MKVKQEGSGERDHTVEAHLLLDDGDVIAGSIADGEQTRPFHGWLELMDALEALRSAPSLRERPRGQRSGPNATQTGRSG